jgi:hypothetical protein
LARIGVVCLLAAGTTVAPAAQAVTYDVTLSGVQEVCLAGTADLAYWEKLLRPEGLAPAVKDGRAELSVCAMASRFMGIGFREAVLTVATTATPGSGRKDGLYLVTAVNSNPFFAWVERQTNQAPYQSGTVVAAIEPTRTALGWGEGRLMGVQAVMTAPAAAQRSVQEPFEGPVYLPKDLSPKRPQGAYFAVRLSGTTDVSPFDKRRDSFLLGNDSLAVVKHLRRSHFVPQEWRVRRDATHAKSGTLSR